MLSCVKPQINTKQQDRAGRVSSCSKATQQREIDGPRSQMRSASLHFVCVSGCVRDLWNGRMDVEKGNESIGEREGGENGGQGSQLCFC